jgi:predicted ATP-dependent protease
MAPLTRSELYHPCDISLFDFETTETLEEIEKIIGQDRALEAVDFGSNIRQDGFNLYAMGPHGSGKHTAVTTFLQKKAEQEPVPNDWCYVNNFKDPRKPIAIEMAAGKAVRFQKDIADLIELLKTTLPTVFESNEHRIARERVNQKYVDKQAEIFRKLKEEAARHDVAMESTSPSRVTFAPILDGKVLSNNEFNALNDEQKAKINEQTNKFQAIVKEALREVGLLSKTMQKELKELDHRTTADAVGVIIDELRAAYADYPRIVEYLDALQDDVIENVKDFLARPEEADLPPFLAAYNAPSFRRYEVNVFISHESDESAPVIFEDNPSHHNLIGHIEHISQIGTLVTDFNLIKPGALQKANGGYLILDARKLLMQPFSYEELKRVLRAKEIRIESLAQQYSLISTVSLEPEPIPINIKVVLIGERYIYYLLYHYDPEFKELFKVAADFEEEMPRDQSNMMLYASMIASMAKKNDVLPLTPEAVGRVIEKSSRNAEDASKLSTHLGSLSDLLKEADYWARKAQRGVIDKTDIETALNAQEKRVNRLQHKLYEQIEAGTLIINTKGKTVGQINALSVISMGGYQFGTPSRVTARTRMGKGEILDIQRKAELSGPIHTKGVMILSSYLSSQYATSFPLSLSASLVFEQSYGMVEGDSASSTELYALLSSLSGLPIKQNIAVTGSVNQYGEVQAIGGVNEKIEGFFDVCMRLDPDNSHGVLIPKANVKHLMLKTEILEAVDKGSFAVYAVSTIDDGIAILTGRDAGEADEQGNYPDDSVNGLVVARLKTFAEAARRFYKEKKRSENDTAEE